MRRVVGRHCSIVADDVWTDELQQTKTMGPHPQIPILGTGVGDERGSW